MKKEYTFILAFLATIVIERIFLFFAPSANFIWNDNLHHLYYGVILIFASIIYKNKLNKSIVIPFAVGLGLIADELIFLLPFFYGDGTKYYYFSLPSVIGVILIALLVVLLRRKIIKKIEIKKKKKKVK